MPAARRPWAACSPAGSTAAADRRSERRCAGDPGSIADGSQIPASCISCAGAGGHGVGRPDVDRPPLPVEGQHDVGERPGTLDAVLDQDQRRGPPVAQGAQSLEEVVGTGWIEVGRRLVEDDHLGKRREYTGQGEALLLPARQSSRSPPFEAAEPDLAQCVRDSRVHPCWRPGSVLEAEGHVVFGPFHDQLRGRILEDQADPGGQRRRIECRHGRAVELQRALDRRGDVARHESGQREGERALARSRRTDDQQRGSVGHRE